MKRVLQLVLGALLTVGVLFVVAGLLLSRQWRVQHSIIIVATPERIHPFVENLHRWESWASWRSPDPTLSFAYEGPESGVGASRSFHGQRAGHGRTTIVRSEPTGGVWFESAVNSDAPNASGSITYRPAHNATEVTWQDTGELPPIIGGYLRDSVEQGLRTHLEQALTRLKAAAEAVPPP